MNFMHADLDAEDERRMRKRRPIHAVPSARKKQEGRRDNRWPAGGTPVVAGVHPPGFAPVTEEALQEIVRRLVTGLQPHKILLFGSYVYGTPSADSDVDLLVIVDTQARPVDRYVCVSRLLRPRPFPLDILVKTPEEIAQALDSHDDFICEIMAQGRVLYERSD
jgi:predicted nucleotidyltransferase